MNVGTVIQVVSTVHLRESSCHMSEEAIFFRQAAEAIVATSLNSANLDPTIKELLGRIKYVNPDLQNAPASQELRPSISETRSATNEPISSYSTNSNLSSNESGVLLPADNKRLIDYLGDPLSHAIAGSNNISVANRIDEFISEVDPTKKERKISKSEKTNAENGSESGTDEKRFPCAKCTLIFRRSSDLRRHERTHLPVLPNICSQCGKGFARKDALKRHFNTLTCKRNRNKLLSIGGDINEILERARQSGTDV